MTKEQAITEAIVRLVVTDHLLALQLFEQVHGGKEGKVKIPAHLEERFGEESLLSWDSTPGKSTLHPDVVDVVKRIPWTPGTTPQLLVLPTPK